MKGSNIETFKTLGVWFKLLYALFVISSIVYVKQRFLPLLTLRQLMAVIMFVACIANDKTVRVDKYFKIYLGYIVCYGISAAFTGYIEDFFNRLIGDFFVAYVMYWSTSLICVRFKASDVLISTLVFVGAFDAIVTVFQALSIHILDPIINALDLISYERLADWQASRDTLMGLAVPGIVSHPVVNGHFLLLCYILSLTFFINKINLKALLFCSILFVGVFFCQQRAGFILAIVLTIYIVFKLFNRGGGATKWIISFLAIVLILSIIPALYEKLMSGNNRYAELGLDSSGRNYLFNAAWNFYLKNPLIGGYRAFCVENVLPPHNFLVSTLLAGGIFGAAFMFIMVFQQLKSIIKVLLSKHGDMVQIIAGTTFIALLTNSFAHNISLMNGDVMTWMTWGLFLYYKSQ